MANFKTLDDDEYTDEDKYGVQDVIDEINEEPAPAVELSTEEMEEEEDLSDMSEVEIRLEEANCLKALLYNSLFEEPLSPIAKRVERRIRAFIHQELKTLLGIEVVVKPKEAPLFESDELLILKALAKKALSKLPVGTVNSVGSGDGLIAVGPIATSVIGISPAFPHGITGSASSPKATQEPLIKKTQAPTSSVKVRRAKPPKAKPTPAPVQETLFPEKEVTLPNGMVSKVSTQRQVKPSGGGGYPTLSPEQQAAYYEQQALTSKPQSGILGIMARAVDQHNSTSNED